MLADKKYRKWKNNEASSSNINAEGNKILFLKTERKINR